MKTKLTAYLFIVFISSTQGFTQNLKDVTLGFAPGVSYTFSDIYDYSLSPDVSNLKVQKLSKGAFVVSSMLTVKFKKLKVDESTRQIREQNSDPAGFKDRLALNIGINLLEIKNDVKFNKSIDGGIGIGCFIHENTQIAFMFDISTVRQMRPYIIESFRNKQIPNGNGFYNALDMGDNNLFYNKTACGISLKAVLSL